MFVQHSWKSYYTFESTWGLSRLFWEVLQARITPRSGQGAAHATIEPLDHTHSCWPLWPASCRSQNTKVGGYFWYSPSVSPPRPCLPVARSAFCTFAGQTLRGERLCVFVVFCCSLSRSWVMSRLKVKTCVPARGFGIPPLITWLRILLDSFIHNPMGEAANSSQRIRRLILR